MLSNVNLTLISRILLRKIPLETDPQNSCFVCKLKMERLQLLVGLRTLALQAGWVQSGDRARPFREASRKALKNENGRVVRCCRAAGKPWFLRWLELWHRGPAKLQPSSVGCFESHVCRTLRSNSWPFPFDGGSCLQNSEERLFGRCILQKKSPLLTMKTPSILAKLLGLV